MTFVPYDRPVRAAFVGLGRIYDLNVRAYVDNPDVEVVALVDPSEERRIQRQADWPSARTFASVAELAASGLEIDAVEALLPIPLHVDGVIELLGHGWHVNLQKPMCNDLASAAGCSTPPGPTTGSAAGDGELHLLRAAGPAQGEWSSPAPSAT
jgi:predicted dehydrogenase